MQKPRTHAEHVQLIREGKDYFSPKLAINETIDGLVHCALVVREHEDGTCLTAEARALDAIGVQVERELKNRKEMIHALTDRLQAVEAELKAKVAELAQVVTQNEILQHQVPRDNDPGPQDGRKTLHIRPELESAQFSG